MSYRSVQTAGAIGGGAVLLCTDPGRARNVNVTILNPSAVTHGAFFGRSRRELQEPGPIGVAGFCIVAVANNVVTATIGTVAYTSFTIQGWVGELWVAADVDGILQIDCFESGAPEK